MKQSHIMKQYLPLVIGIAFGLLATRAISFYDKYQDAKEELIVCNSIIEQKTDSITMLKQTLAQYEHFSDTLVARQDAIAE